ncbi:MAG: helix-turn-helix transcriptional regulator [Candidatus Thiodiazotropha sp. (ex Troendleina suluensis)]|nr:helix-turn-helix transcriptional regulator [Candidatus Thiodiazotropha sp. (ex Troendleina suluensis)]
MSTEFSLDLRLARRKAGLTQKDTAHLLGIYQSVASDLERGMTLPTLLQIVTLSLIYNRSFESLFSELMKEAKQQLSERVHSLPENVRHYSGTFNRTATINRLRQRLSVEDSAHDTT